MGGIGGPELLVVFLVVLLVFGPKKIPEVARGVGKGLREIRRLTTEFQREINLSDLDEDKKIAGGPPAAKPGPPGNETPAADAPKREDPGESPPPGPESPS